MSSAIASACWLLKLSWGSEVRRYAAWDRDVSFSGETWLATPNMRATLPIDHGGVEAKEGEIEMPDSLDPWPNVVLGHKHALIRATVYACDPTTGTGTFLFDGWATMSRPAESAPTVQVTIAGHKSRLSGVRVGLPCVRTCVHKFGGRWCGIAVPSYSGTISAVSGTSVTLSLDSSPTITNQLFRHGKIVVDGLGLRIRSWTSGTTFSMGVQVPPWWMGRDCTLHEGCDKQRSTCEARANSLRWCGPGVVMPARNPIFES